MLRLTLRSRFSVSLLAVAFAWSLGHGRAATEPAQVSLLEAPVLFVDPATNSATAHIRLINKSAQPITKISLSVGPFISTTSGKDIGAKATFSGPADATGKPTFEIASLAPKATNTVKIDIANLWEAGESEAALYNNGTEIGKLKAVKYRPPFAVKLNGPAPTAGAPESVELQFEQDRAAQITLKNEDSMTYPVQWELTVGDKTLSGSETVILPPNSTKAITVTPPKEWFTSVTGLLKDEVKDGTLTLSLQPPLSIAYPLLPQRSLPLKARLRNWSENKQLLLGISIVFLALLVGALVSLILRDFIPNKLQRIRYEESLDEIDSNLQDVAKRVKDSSLIVPVSVERNRLLRILKSVWFFNPEIGTVFAQCREGIDTLNMRLSVLEEIARAWEQLYDRKQQNVAPSLILKAREKIREAGLSLKRTHPRDKNLDEAKARLAAARQIMEGSKENVEFSRELAERVKELMPVFTEEEINSGIFKLFKDQLTDLRKAFDAQYQDQKTIQPTHYFTLDMRTSLLRVILSYVTYFQRSGVAHPERKEDYEQCEGTFRKYLEMRNFFGLQNASIIVDEMQQNIFGGSILKALRANPPEIFIDCESEVRENQALELRARFHDQALNKAAARDKITPIWEFAHEGQFTDEVLRAKGWVNWHYFPKANKCKARVYFVEDETGRKILRENNSVITLETQIRVTPEPSRRWGDRTKIELTLFVVALAVALVGLITGAREQLQKLDLAAGLIAVFLIGFSADTVKNLLTQSNREKKSEQPENKPAPDPAAAEPKTSA